MCGIAGIIRFDSTPVAERSIAGMNARLAHRGPDGEGVLVRGSAGLGHRRLAIIDLSTGRQPMGNEDGDIQVTFNGEIYNYRELREQLIAKGHRFRSNSDSEVIVHAYEEWGDDCVSRFRGMFAFAVMDWKNGRMFLARDHFGIKPLYYAHGDGFLAFASELQALRTLPELQLPLDMDAIDQYLCLQYIPAPATIYRTVRKLKPAQRLTVRFDGTVTGPDTYWKAAFRPDRSRTHEQWLEELDTVLRDSVRAHLVADVPSGAFLSGGADSSGIVAYMSSILDEPVRAFSIGFEDPDFNELPHAREAALRFQAEHHYEVVKPDALGILPHLIRNYGEPFGDSSAVPTYYVSKLARGFVPFVLSGDGGDEFFAGYESYRGWLDWLNPTGRPLWKRSLRRLAQAAMPRRYPARAVTAANWLRFVNYLSFSSRRKLWRHELHRHCRAVVEPFEEFHADNDAPASFAQLIDVNTYLPNDILTKVDVASMMHGLEVRTPLVDVQVAEFACRVPESLNIARSISGTTSGKLLFKKNLERFFPRQFLERRKQGFAAPIQDWLSSQQAAGMKQRLLDDDSPLQSLFDRSALRSLVARDPGNRTWLLLVLDEWMRQNRASA